MEHADRRKELGKMLMDVSKYLLTVGLVGGIITDKMSIAMGSTFFVLSVVSAVIGFFIIPKKRREG
jgi:hypothetical protein